MLQPLLLLLFLLLLACFRSRARYQNMSRWAQLVAFADKTGVQLVFGLNAMNGRPADNATLGNMSNIEVHSRHMKHANPTS